MDFRERLEATRKAIGHKKAKSHALDQAKKPKFNNLSKQTYSPGYGHGIDEGKKKPSINKRKSPLLRELEK